jgi:hypothetical protein
MLTHNLEENLRLKQQVSSDLFLHARDEPCEKNLQIGEKFGERPRSMGEKWRSMDGGDGQNGDMW